MTSVYALVRISLTEEQLTAAASRRVPQGFTAWQRIEHPSHYLFVVPHPDLHAAEDYLRKALANGVFPGELPGGFVSTPDVQVIQVGDRHGIKPAESKIGNLLSLSIRIAEPGFQAELFADLETVFRELEALDGFLGWSFGSRANLEEEIIGIGLWSDFEAYKASLPHSQRMSELTVYKRVF
jgi:hypothetical protein